LTLVQLSCKPYRHRRCTQQRRKHRRHWS